MMTSSSAAAVVAALRQSHQEASPTPSAAAGSTCGCHAKLNRASSLRPMGSKQVTMANVMLTSAVSIIIMLLFATSTWPNSPSEAAAPGLFIAAKTRTHAAASEGRQLRLLVALASAAGSWGPAPFILASAQTVGGGAPKLKTITIPSTFGGLREAVSSIVSSVIAGVAPGLDLINLKDQITNGMSDVISTVASNLFKTVVTTGKVPSSSADIIGLLPSASASKVASLMTLIKSGNTTLNDILTMLGSRNSGDWSPWDMTQLIAAGHLGKDTMMMPMNRSNPQVAYLLELKDRYPLTNQMQTWQENATCATWQEVYCDDTKGIITEVFMMDLIGSVPTDLHRLPSLTALGLGGSFLTGELPSAIFSLTSLTALLVEGSKLKGDLSADISKLDSLQHLRLRNNELTGQLPRSLSALTNLVTLDISRNRFYGQVPPNTLMESIRYFDIGSNYLSGFLPLFSPVRYFNRDVFYNVADNYFSLPIPSSIGLLNLPAVWSSILCLKDFPYRYFSRNCLGEPLASVTCADGRKLNFPLNPRRASECSQFCGADSSTGLICGGLGVCAPMGPSLTPTCICSNSRFIPNLDAVTVNVAGLGTSFTLPVPGCVAGGQGSGSGSSSSSSNSMTGSNSVFFRGLSYPQEGLLHSATADSQLPSFNSFFRHASNGATVPPWGQPFWSYRSQMDWRTRNVLTPVKEQKSCSACWVFGPIAAVEAAVAITLNQAAIAISEQAVLDCQSLWNCNGGYTPDAFQSIIASSRLQLAYDVPYVSRYGPNQCSVYQGIQASCIFGNFVLNSGVGSSNGSSTEAASAMRNIINSIGGDSVDESSIVNKLIDIIRANANEKSLNANLNFLIGAGRSVARVANGALGVIDTINNARAAVANASDSIAALAEGLSDTAEDGRDAVNLVANTVNSAAAKVTQAVTNPVKNAIQSITNLGNSALKAITSPVKNVQPKKVVKSIKKAFGIRMLRGLPYDAMSAEFSNYHHAASLPSSPDFATPRKLQASAASSSSLNASCPMPTSQVPVPANVVSVTMFEEVKLPGWLGRVLAVQQQPVTADVEASQPSFLNYDGSVVYADEDCYFNRVVDHTVLIVGYNLNAGKPFWIIRNSWGPTWGDGGYMQMAIVGGDGICGINTSPSLYPVIKGPNPCGPINPCGGGKCTVDSATGRNKCSCKSNFVAVINTDKTETCAPRKACQFFLSNPCSTGTCVDDNRGGYSCLCPFGFVAGTRNDGSATCTEGTTPSRVVLTEGATCSDVQLTYNLTTAALSNLNPGLDCSSAAAGSVIVIGTRPANALDCIVPYTVVENDTCATIAQLFQIPAPTLNQVNSALDCSTLSAGDQICIAVGVRKPLDCYEWYAPTPGDTCETIRTLIAKPALSPFAFFGLNPGIICSGPEVFEETPPVANIFLNGMVCIRGDFRGATRCANSYVVKAGDTCSSITTWQFGGSARRMRSMNPTFECTPATLRPNRVLCVPAATVY